MGVFMPLFGRNSLHFWKGVVKLIFFVAGAWW
jgi:hypothetical protein